MAPPGCRHRELLGGARRRSDRRGAECGHPACARRVALAAHARPRLSARADRGRSDPSDRCRAERDRRRVQCRQLRLGSPCRAHRRCSERRARGSSRLGRHGVDPHCAPDREAPGHHRLDGRPRDHLPRDRRPREARAAARDARRQCPQHGALGARDAPASRVGDRSLLADRRQPGRDPARVQRGHLRFSLGGEGDRDDDDVLRASGLRRARASARDRHRPPRRRRREPWQPPLRRGRGRDPHRQPDGRGEEVESRATGRSSRTATTRRARSSSSAGRSSSSGPRP